MEEERKRPALSGPRLQTAQQRRPQKQAGEWRPKVARCAPHHPDRAAMRAVRRRRARAWGGAGTSLRSKSRGAA